MSASAAATLQLSRGGGGGGASRRNKQVKRKGQGIMQSHTTFDMT